jgi:HEAT repeat protein
MPHPLRTLALLTGLAVAGCSKPAAPLTAGGRPVAHWLDELKKPDPKARKKAVRELGHVGKADPAAIPAVTGALKDSDAAVRQEACLALLNLGPDAADADAALAGATQDPDAKVREYAAEALAKVRGTR